MKKLFKKNLSTYFLLLSVACTKSPLGNNPSKANKHVDEGFRFSVSYVEPTKVSGDWVRVLTFHGEDVKVKTVDRQVEGEYNWDEVGLTDDQGRYFDAHVQKKTRYRFAGVLVTPWFDGASDLLIDQNISLPAAISAWRCIIPNSVNLYLETKNLVLKCHDILVLGNIYSFKNPTATKTGSKGLSSGGLNFEAQNIQIQGNIALVGQNGAPGKNGEDSSPDDKAAANGKVGGNGGNGGMAILKAKDKLEVFGTVNVRGGRGGAGGKAAQIRSFAFFGNGKPGAGGRDGLNGSVNR